MSLSSERIYKRKPSIINRHNLLNAIFAKYIKTVYCGVLSTNVKLNDRQLIRHEYFNDIQECLMNYCQLTDNTIVSSGSRDEIKSCLRNAEKRKSVKRTASVSFKKSKFGDGIFSRGKSKGSEEYRDADDLLDVDVELMSQTK